MLNKYNLCTLQLSEAYKPELKPVESQVYLCNSQGCFWQLSLSADRHSCRDARLNKNTQCRLWSTEYKLVLKLTGSKVRLCTPQGRC